MRRLILAVLGLAVLTSALKAQLKVDVQLVSVVATVTDTRNRYVPDLVADDFILEEDGQRQTISHFEQAMDLPVSMGVVLDTSGSMERKIRTATDAVDRFIRTVHPDDDIFLMTFSDRPQLRQDFTSSRERLTAALRRISVNGGTALYDALDESLTKIKRGSHQKKAILLITDGQDTASYITLTDAQRAVRESEMLVYCLGISPSGEGPLSGAPPLSLPRLPGGIPFPLPRGPAGGGPINNPDTVDM